MQDPAGTTGDTNMPPPLPAEADLEMPASGAAPAIGAAPQAESEEAGLAERLQPIVAPLVERARLNLCVWLPFLANPRVRQRQVKYPQRDYHDEHQWNIELPKQCWKTGQTEGLKSREYEFTVRGFEMAASIVGVSLGMAVFFALLAAVTTWKLLLLSVVSLVAGAVGLWVKSWTDEVRLVIYTTMEQADALRCPDVVIYERDLYVTLPTVELAEQARSEAAERRRTRQAYRPSMPTPGQGAASGPAGVEGGQAAAPPRRPPIEVKRPELPPIKLDD